MVAAPHISVYRTGLRTGRSGRPRGHEVVQICKHKALDIPVILMGDLNTVLFDINQEHMSEDKAFNEWWDTLNLQNNSFTRIFDSWSGKTVLCHLSPRGTLAKIVYCILGQEEAWQRHSSSILLQTFSWHNSFSWLVQGDACMLEWRVSGSELWAVRISPLAP